MVFPSSSSLNGHPGRPGKRAAGGGGRPGARGPGRGPTVVWAQSGCWSFLSPKFQSDELSSGSGVWVKTAPKPTRDRRVPAVRAWRLPTKRRWMLVHDGQEVVGPVRSGNK